MLIKRLELKNLLSFQDTSVDLRPLNVLIGANASGKSNLIDVISLLKATPTSFSEAIRQGGGIGSWLSAVSGSSAIAEISCELDLGSARLLRYHLAFAEEARSSVITSESLREGRKEYFKRSRGSLRSGANSIPISESYIAVRKDPADKTPITELGRLFAGIRIYRDFLTAGPRASARHGIGVSWPKDMLSENGENLALMLQELDFQGKLDIINGYLKHLSDRFLRVKVRLEGGYAQTYLEEAGLGTPLSAARLSDGTLKFLCLATVLLDAKASPLICIEEPEIGLHPEAIDIIVDLLIRASNETQLIVTTHSEALISALSHRPDDVLVCERDFDGGTQFARLDKDKLAAWLDRYSLGDLWRKGEIGGTRW